jgi:hypothetical protein
VCAYTSIVYDQKVDLNRELEDACVGAHNPCELELELKPDGDLGATQLRLAGARVSSSLAKSDTTRLSYNLRSLEISEILVRITSPLPPLATLCARCCRSKVLSELTHGRAARGPRPLSTKSTPLSCSGHSSARRIATWIRKGT